MRHLIYWIFIGVLKSCAISLREQKNAPQNSLHTVFFYLFNKVGGFSEDVFRLSDREQQLAHTYQYTFSPEDEESLLHFELEKRKLHTWKEINPGRFHSLSCALRICRPVKNLTATAWVGAIITFFFFLNLMPSSRCRRGVSVIGWVGSFPSIRAVTCLISHSSRLSLSLSLSTEITIFYIYLVVIPF